MVSPARGSDATSPSPGHADRLRSELHPQPDAETKDRGCDLSRQREGHVAESTWPPPTGAFAPLHTTSVDPSIPPLVRVPSTGSPTAGEGIGDCRSESSDQTGLEGSRTALGSRQNPARYYLRLRPRPLTPHKRAAPDGLARQQQLRGQPQS